MGNKDRRTFVAIHEEQAESIGNKAYEVLCEAQSIVTKFFIYI